MNRPRDEGILIACFFSPHALFFKLHGGCGVFICVNNHLSVITLCAHYIVLC